MHICVARYIQAINTYFIISSFKNYVLICASAGGRLLFYVTREEQKRRRTRAAITCFGLNNWPFFYIIYIYISGRTRGVVAQQRPVKKFFNLQQSTSCGAGFSLYVYIYSISSSAGV